MGWDFDDDIMIEMMFCLHVVVHRIDSSSGTLDPIAESIIGLERAGTDMSEGKRLGRESILHQNPGSKSVPSPMSSFLFLA